MKFNGRENELRGLRSFIEDPKAKFMYVRGRRRVGKSWLLKRFVETQKNAFYFMGTPDATNQVTVETFVKEWDVFSKKRYLSELKPHLLSWKRIFQEITEFAKKGTAPLILIFDEIQWIAKTGSGFLGKLKEAWQDWEKTDRIKVIICGSSNRFFRKVSGSEEKVLRGLISRASLWVPPFSLLEVRRYYFPRWTEQEVALVYMMFGGIPYYLEQFDAGLGFIHAINEAVFTARTIFLEEIGEILSLDFNRKGQRNVKRILSAIDQNGSPQNAIVQKTGISASTVSEVLTKLVEYEIVWTELPVRQGPVKNEAGYRYRIKDFFINFYFRVLEPITNQIKNNRSGLLFPYAAFPSKKSLYIPNFSGPAFEHLVRYVLEDFSNRGLAIFGKLKLLDANYRIGTYWDNLTQIDIIAEHDADRLSRAIECKWSASADKKWMDELKGKKYSLPEGWQRLNFLVVSERPPKAFNLSAAKAEIQAISLSDLFS